MRRRLCLAKMASFVVITVGFVAAPALAQDCPELVFSPPYGSSQAVTVSGDYAYFGSGSALLVADISSPAAPQIVGDVALPEGAALGIAVSGGYAYIADGLRGLRIIDVSTPSVPTEVGSVDTPGTAYEVAVLGIYAYVADGEAGLRVIDVSDPSTPLEAGSFDTPGTAYDVAVSGSYAYVTWDGGEPGPGGLDVIDVSIPSAPVVVGFVDIPGVPWGVEISGGYAYVIEYLFGLVVVDVRAPSAPLVAGSVGLSGAERGVAVDGAHAYVVGDWPGLAVVSVDVPSTPLLLGYTYLPDTPEDVGLSGGFAYVADRGAGLRVVDVSVPSAPVEVGSVAVPDNASGVAVEGGYAYITDLLDLRVLDVSTPSAPVEIGYLDTPGETSAIAVSGGYVYLLADGALRVIDVSTPSVPAEVGSVDVTGGDLAVSGNYAYVVGDAFRVIDVSTPSAPVIVGTLGGLPRWRVVVSGDYAYVLQSAFEGWVSLVVIDVSTPSAPADVGLIGAGFMSHGLAVSDGYVYVAGSGGLLVIDVSVPSAPATVGFADIGVGTSDVAVSSGYAYVAGDLGLHVIDVRFPSAPVAVAFYEALNGGPFGYPQVAVSDGYLFFASVGPGLFIFSECTHPDADGRVTFIPAAAVAAGAQGAFFQTDVEINNTGTEAAEVSFQWLPRGEDNSDPVESDPITLAAGHSLRWENVLTELFGFEPDSLGALKLVASTESVIGMSRTYNIPAGETAGTFGQGLPAIRATEMIMGTEPQRIIFLSENADSRANVGCVNGSSDPVTINIELFDDEGAFLETKTLELGPYSNDQINRIFQDYEPVNGYVDVWADGDDALYSCYGSMLDNLTSDPTTILPQVPSSDTTFIPAAALSAGLEGSFFSTDVDLNNVGSTHLTYELLWLPRGEDNSDPITSDTFSLAAGAGVRYANVLDELFGLEPDAVGALAVEASGTHLLAMSRTYNLPSAKVAGTFGQELPGIPADRMIPTGVTKRIIFLSENDDVRANVGCVNGTGVEVAVRIDLYDSDGVTLETTYMMLPPYSNRQINGIFRDYAPVNGYVEFRTNTPDALISCYGSVLDNLTSDPTTVLPM